MCLLIPSTNFNPFIYLSISLLIKGETNSEEVQKQLTSGTAVLDVKIDMHTSVFKLAKTANWLIAALNLL